VSIFLIVREAASTVSTLIPMKTIHGLTFGLWLSIVYAVFAQDPLPSWNDTAPKKAIIAFIEKVTKEGFALVFRVGSPVWKGISECVVWFPKSTLSLSTY
jgi:hypothetical protein